MRLTHTSIASLAGLSLASPPALRARQAPQGLDPPGNGVQKQPNDASVIGALATALPSSIMGIAATNSPAASSMLASQISGDTPPTWFKNLPKDVQSYLLDQGAPTAWKSPAPGAATPAPGAPPQSPGAPATSAPGASPQPTPPQPAPNTVIPPIPGVPPTPSASPPPPPPSASSQSSPNAEMSRTSAPPGQPSLPPPPPPPPNEPLSSMTGPAPMDSAMSAPTSVAGDTMPADPEQTDVTVTQAGSSGTPTVDSDPTVSSTSPSATTKATGAATRLSGSAYTLAGALGLGFLLNLLGPSVGL